MNLAESDGKNFVFEFHPGERKLFAAILQMYPLLSPDYHTISQREGDSKVEESRRLLHDALAEQQAAHRKTVAEFLDGEHWQLTEQGTFLVALSTEKMEWLLQVLNDVRVGSWVKLGRPNQHQEDKIISDQRKSQARIHDLPYIGALKLSGAFQSILLSALEL